MLMLQERRSRSANFSWVLHHILKLCPLNQTQHHYSAVTVAGAGAVIVLDHRRETTQRRCSGFRELLLMGSCTVI